MRPINRWCYMCKRHVGNKQPHRTGCAFTKQVGA